jgi:HK97 family phage major capsid protein
VNLKELLAAALKRANELAEKAKTDAGLTAEESTEFKGKVAEAKDLKERIARAEESQALVAELGGLADHEEKETPEQRGTKTLGDAFVKHVGDTKRSLKQRGTIEGPEFKAATDTQVTGGTESNPIGVLLTQVDRTIVSPYRRPMVTDLLGSGSISGQAITYFVEGAREGNFTTVGEATQKPQLHYVNPTPVTDRLKEIAGWIRLSDDMVDDLDFLVSEINTRLLYDLSLVEEGQLLNGDGTGNNLLGVLNRSGLQTAASANRTDNADVIFRAAMAIQTVTGLSADGLVIHPTDYQALRLTKDDNGQYFGGGFFAGQYGNGGIEWQPPVWGLRTVVTPAVPAGAPVVGAFKQATTVYRKGGVRVESTNSHQDDFTNDRITIRAKERLALAVRRPSAIVKVTLSNADPA